MHRTMPGLWYYLPLSCLPLEPGSTLPSPARCWGSPASKEAEQSQGGPSCSDAGLLTSLLHSLMFGRHSVQVQPTGASRAISPACDICAGTTNTPSEDGDGGQQPLGASAGTREGPRGEREVTLEEKAKA